MHWLIIKTGCKASPQSFGLVPPTTQRTASNISQNTKLLLIPKYLPVRPVEIFTGHEGTFRHTAPVAKANYQTNNTAKSILDASCLLSDMTFQARAAESTNLSYLGIQEAEKKREMQADRRTAWSY